MNDQNKELDKKIKFSEYEWNHGQKQDHFDYLINGIENIKMNDNQELISFQNVKPRHSVAKFFQNCSSLDDKIRFIDYLGYHQLAHYKNKLKKPRLIKKNYNNLSDLDKSLFKISAIEKIDEIKKHLNTINELNKDSAFEINIKLTIKIGNQYHFSNEIFDWTKEYKISEFLNLKGLKSSFSDHSEIKKNEILIQCLNETKFVKQNITISYKLILINEDGLFENIFGYILNNRMIDETDKCVINQIIASRSIELKIDENYKILSILIIEHSKYQGMTSNFDVINDSFSNYISPIAKNLNLKPKLWGSYKYDTRFQIKQEIEINKSSFKKFHLLQNALNRIIRLTRSKQLFLKCKRNQFQFLREKTTTSYTYTYHLASNYKVHSEYVKDYCISFNIVNYVEYYFNRNNQNDEELCLRPNNHSFTSLSIISDLNDIIKNNDFNLTLNEILENSWDLGLWLAQTASFCV
jgi:hypothetical protein